MIDPEAFEPTEEQFASSVDDDGEPQDRQHVPRRRAPAPRTGLEREFAERDALDSRLGSQVGRWREEVANRVEGYRTKKSKKRLSGEFSMRFEFEPCVYPTVAAPEPEPAPEPDILIEEAPLPPQAPVTAAAVPAPQPEVFAQEPLPDRVTRHAARVRKASVIEFPRLNLPYFDDPNALAEPVFDRPRILEVPEEVPTEPLPDAVVVPPIGEPEEEPAVPAFELPLRVAPIPHRLTAALVDAVLVLVATAVFAGILLRFGPPLPHTKPVLGFALAIPVVFWAIYHYLFLVHAGSTLGMSMAHIHLRTFEGAPVRRSVRRVRALMLVLSGLSLGLGFLWALFDEDTLCWHDKMTSTYLTIP